MALSRTHLCQKLVKSFAPTLQCSRFPAFAVTSDFHTSSSSQNKGQIFDKKPAKVELEAEKKYSWCSCGHSKKQPFCDGSHKKEEGGFKPVRFECEESKAYFMCNCKQTNHAPFCDGTHKRL